MDTKVEIDGMQFLINDSPTYKDIEHEGRKIEGLLFNSRMVQAIFDDENPETAIYWRYPDTGTWDPYRNTQEFCDMLPEYRKYGLLAVTVGLQGGGSIYRSEVYDRYLNSAFTQEGNLKTAYFERLFKILDIASKIGMVVIVNYFYWRQATRLDEKTIIAVAEKTTEWLLNTGFRNILVDVMNEVEERTSLPDILNSSGIDRLIEIVKSIHVNGRRLLVGSSTGGGNHLPIRRWRDIEDFHLPHGNGCYPEELRRKLRILKASDDLDHKPRPIVVNEDTIFLDNFEAAIDEYCSWGFYCQGYGSCYRDRMDWTVQDRETRYEELSGFQTLPVNWRINDPYKKAFFERLAEITQSKKQF